MKNRKGFLSKIIVLCLLLTIIASVAACTQVVEFKVNFIVDGEIYKTINTAGEEAISLPADPTKNGYIFDGWYWDEDVWSRPFTAESLQAEKLTADMSVYAKWITEEEAKIGVVSFETNGGSQIADIRTEKIETAPVSDKKGYILEGWYTNASLNGEYKVSFPLTVVNDMCLYAKWTTVTYKINYETNGGKLQGDYPDGYSIETSIVLPEPEKAGCKFIGWYENSDFSGKPQTEISVGNTGEKTYYAKWEINGYQISFDSMGGSEVEDIVANYGDKISAPVIPERRGYIFKGWYKEKSFDTLFVFENMPAENVKLYAKWEAETYQIKYHTNGGILPSDAASEYTIEISLTLPVPDNGNYIFIGWYDNASCEGSPVVSINKGEIGEKEFWAKWSLNAYSITYHLNEGINGNNPPSYTEDSATIVLDDPTRTGHSFKGWYDNENFLGNKITEIASGSTGNKTFWAKWEINTYTLHFEMNGADEKADESYLYNEQMQEPIDPVRMGYDFEGWYADSKFNEEFVFGMMPANNLTVYAKWSIVNYSITYIGADNELPDDIVKSYTIEDRIELIVPNRKGYTFNGWYETEDYSGNEITIIEKGTVGNKTYYAKFTINQYTIKFNTNGGGDIDPITQDYETDIEEPAVPEKTGYIFGGWYSDIELSNAFVFDKMPAQDVTLYAKWTAITYDINYFNVEDAANSNPSVYTAEDEIVLKDPVRTGYTFSYWYLDGNINNKITRIPMGTTGTLNIYASWIKNDNGYAIVSAPNYAFLSDTELKTIIENDISEFDFRGTFTVSSNASWRVFTEADCAATSELTLRIATNLVEGDNFFYVLVENNSTYQRQIYKINLYKKHLYEINLHNKAGDISQNFELLEFEAITQEMIDDSFDLTLSGYSLVGWYFDEQYTEVYEIGAAISKAQSVIDIYSKYEPIVYSITYNTGGGENAVENPSSYIVEDEDIVLKDPIKDGWTFEGWYADADFENGVSVIQTSTLKNYELFAKWAPYTVSDNDDGTLTIISYSGDVNEVNVPEKINGKQVTAIGASVFENRSSLTSITLPAGVTDIGYSAFSGCSSLESITFGENSLLESIGSSAFSGCSSLTSITIPDSVTEISSSAFSGCTLLTEINYNAVSVVDLTEESDVFCNAGTSSDGIKVIFGENVQSIPAYLFSVSDLLNRPEVTHITISDSVTSIGKYAFYGCGLLTSITIPESVTSIGSSAFAQCNITTANIPADAISYIPEDMLQTVIINSGSSIGERAFYNCTSLTSITIPESVTSIGSSAFYDCNSLEAVYITDIATWCNISFEYASSNPLYYAHNLYVNGELVTELEIPDGVTSISSYAFYNCSSLTSITIPYSVASISSYAFCGCSLLENVSIRENSLLESIGDYAFGACASLTSITIPESVTSIGSSAFDDCSSLVSVMFGENSLLASIGSSAFDGCSSLTSITIPESVTSIGSSAFDGCSILTIYCEVSNKPSTWDDGWNGNSPVVWDCNNSEVADDGNIYYVAENGIRYALNDENATVVRQSASLGGDIEIPSYINYKDNVYTVTALGDSAFFGCASLMSITIPNSVTSIGPYAFAYCSSLTSITIPDSITSIGSSAFNGCSSLESITLPFIGAKAGVTSSDTYQYPLGYIFGTSSYSGGTGVGQYYYGSSTSSTTYEYYYIPSTLRNVTVTGGNILYGAFYKCSMLTSITMPDNVTNIGSSAFYDCNSLEAVYITDIATWCNISFEYASSNPLYYAHNLYVNGELVTELEIPDGVTSISSYAFYNCSSLTSITIPASVTSIGSYAFYNCTLLAKINYDAVNVADLTEEDYTFGNAGANTNGIKVIFGESVERIPAYLFDVRYSSPSLKIISVTIGSNITSIGSNAFDYRSSLEAVYITDIATWCNISFEYASSNPLCYALNLYVNGELVTELDIPDGVTGVSSYAFYGCSSLTRITIPDSVTSIGSSAFDGCSSLTIYCEVASKPSGWDSNWNYGNSPVVWDCKNSEVDENGYIYYIDQNGIRYALKDGMAIVVRQSASLGGDIEIPSNINYKDNVYTVTALGSSAFSGCSSLTSITIPESVTSIGPSAFDGCSSLVSVTFGENSLLASIGSYAFSGCSSLTSIIIPDSVKSIGFDAFYGCSSLENVSISENSLLKSIGDYAFGGCVSLTSIMIPDSVKSIGENAFRNCSSLVSVTFGENSLLASIGSYAFYECSSLTSITIPDGVKSISSYAFFGCSLLENVSIRENSLLESIGDYAFGGCVSLTSIIIPGSVKSISSYAFFGCSLLENVSIRENSLLESIGDCAFGACASLTSITIPDSVTSIGDYAFYDCSSITNVIIPLSVTKIGESAFNSSNTTIYCESASKPAGWDSNWASGVYSVIWGYNNLSTNLDYDYIEREEGVYLTKYKGSSTDIIVPAEIDGKSVIGFGSIFAESRVTNVIIENGIIKIDDYAFYDCSSLTSITIPDSVTSIGDCAFYGCSSLMSVIIPEAVTNIGDFAFAGCTSLTEINYNAVSVEDLTRSSDAFYNAGKNTDGIRVVFGESVERIPAYLFYVSNSSYSPKVTSVTIGSNVTSIGSYAFSGCTMLTEINYNAVRVEDLTSSSIFYNAGKNSDGITVVFGESVERIPAYLFHVSNSSYSPKITSITIPDSVTSIGFSAFRNCSSLTSITIPDSVTSIGSYAFYNCTSLEVVHITDIEAWCKISFGDLYSNPLCYAHNLYLNGELVTELEIPDGVTSIGSYAFEYCSNLTSITIPDSVTSIGERAFYGCSSLTSITIPDGVTSIGSYAFSGCTSLTEINYNAVGVEDLISSSNVFYNAGKNSDGITVVFGESVERIPANLFYVSNSSYSPKVTSVTIGGNVTSIGHSAFDGCSSLVSVTFGENSLLASIDYDAFYGCSSLTSITIPESVTSIGSSAFRNCSSLVSVTFGENSLLASIGSYAFSGCSSLTSITIPDSVTSIGYYAFSGCTSLTEINYNAINVEDLGYYSEVFSSAGKNANGITVVFGESVERIPAHLFHVNNSSYSPKVTSVTIGSNVTSIGSYAFNGCDLLSSVIISLGVTSIDNYAFNNCSSLTIYCEALSKPSGWYSNWNGSCTVIWGYNNVTTDENYDYVIRGENIILTKYKGNETEVIIPSEIEGKYVIDFGTIFADNTSITKVAIPDSVTSIGENAFYNCSSLESVMFSENSRLESIGKGAFSECSSLTSITIPKEVTNIGEKAFEGCNSLNEINVDEDNTNYKSLGGNLYNKEMTELIKYACGKSDTSFVIPEGITSIGSYAFEYCSSLTSITIPDSVISVDEGAFSICLSLESVTFGGNSQLEDIGFGVFASCMSLVSITIPESVTSIGDYAFWVCISLTNITIPESVTSIGECAFIGCSSLESVYYLGPEQQWTQIEIDDSNSELLNAKIYYYSESEPSLNEDGTVYDGNYWRYVDGVPTPWIKET